MLIFLHLLRMSNNSDLLLHNEQSVLTKCNACQIKGTTYFEENEFRKNMESN